ncbi:NACHT domain-containing NTPase [Arcobacter sp. L]|uniref:NACHT domain-containing protein n=1 Tax=Arcobacter sp. L TaxID=944547 RepID=UPI0002296595|nr:peptide deformylase [Arcobacter sp. L]BAK73794.1 putative peptide deformylase [Arcobacter sp. L]
MSDGFKFIDKKDYLKDFLSNNDDLLSTTSWGKLIKYLGEKTIEISDLNEAYYFTIYTAYLNTFEKALEYFEINSNNFSIPFNEDLKYDYKEFNLSKITSNFLKIYFDGIFKDFVLEENRAKVQRYINNNIKLNYFEILEQNSSVLNKYISHIKSNLGLEEKELFKKNKYKNTIANEYFEVVLGDENALTLNDLYIEPYFRVHKNCFKDNDKRLKEEFRADKYIDIEDESIHNFIDDILNNKNKHKLDLKDVNTIFIAGQPGQGKSSFTKRFIYDMVENRTSLSKDVILIKLKNIKEPNDLKNKSFKEIVKENTRLEIDNLDNYIVVLDGLDELAMKTGLSTSDIELICQKFSRESTTIIITTRHGYLNFDTLNEDNISVLELKELDKTQQLSWLEKYKKIYPNIKLSNKIIEKFHKDEDKHILELINQPILLHMIAKMDIENIEELNKTNLYSEFFEILIKRKWEKDAHTLSKLKGVEQEEYSRVLKNMLKELAFHIFNSEFEYIQKYEFEKLESVQELQKLLSEKNNNESLKSNLKGVMVSFYFKEVKKDEEDINPKEKNEQYAIEFLHKSLMEYMVASYIYDYLDENFLETKRSSGKYIIDDGKDALKELWYLFHQKHLSDEVTNNLIEIIKEKEQSTNDELAKRFDVFLAYLIEKDFLYESNIGNNNPIGKANNTFYGFWQVMCNLDDKNHMPRDKNLKNEIFNQFIKNFIANFNLINMDLSNLFIFYTNIYFIKDMSLFFGINLKDVELIYTNIFSQEKQFININEAKILSSVRIGNIYFEDITFSSEMINNSIFNDCYFIKVKFKNLTLYGNIFQDCTFEDCEEIDFDKLKKNNHFINCTNDGEEI